VLVTGYNLNCGGPATGLYAADANFTGSANTLAVTNPIDTSMASAPAPQIVYQSQRWGEFAYVLNNLFPGSNCTVRLHFAEIADNVNNPGDRRFNVLVNGVQTLTDFDVMALTGQKYAAITRDIKMRADSTGTLLLQFSRGSAGDPMCNGIQALGSFLPPAPTLTRLGVTNHVASLTWQASPGGVYELQTKDDLNETNWTTVPGLGIMLSPFSTMTTNVPAAPDKSFFRIHLIN